MIATWFKNIAREREFSAFSLLRFPFFLAVLLSNFSFKYFRHSLVLNWSKFPSSEDTRPAADEWKHQFQFIFQYQWISARSMALVSMFLCNQSYASHGRDFLLGATIILTPPFWLHMLACSNNPNLCEVSWMSIVSFSLPRAISDHKCVRHLDPPFSSAQCAFFCPKNKLLSICVVRIIVFQYFKSLYFSSTAICS